MGIPQDFNQQIKNILVEKGYTFDGCTEYQFREAAIACCEAAPKAGAAAASDDEPESPKQLELDLTPTTRVDSEAITEDDEEEGDFDGRP